MLTTTAAVVLVGAFLGGLVSGLAGFGTGLTVLGVWLYVLEPAAAGSLVIICSVVSQLQTIPAIWHAIDFSRLWPMLVAGVLGVPIGTALLAHVDPPAFRLGMGCLLLLYSGFMLLGRFGPRIAWGGRAADSAVGLAGGMLGGLAGLSGALPIIWATMRGWGKDERRGVFQAFNLTVLGAALLSHGLSGLLTADVGRLALIALPGTMGGAWLGARAYRRLSDRRFHAVVLVLLMLSGASLVWTSLR